MKKLLMVVILLWTVVILNACDGAGGSNFTASNQSSNIMNNKTNQTAEITSNNEYAYIVDTKNHKVRMNKVGEKGILTEFGTVDFGVKGTSSSSYITISPDNRFAYVPDSSSDIIYVFSIDQSTGMLVLKQYAFAAGSGVEKIIFTPDGKFAYVTSLFCNKSRSTVENCISMFSVDTSSGLLTLNGEVSANKTGAINDLIAIDKTGRFVYTSTSNFDSLNAITQFKVDPASGKLTAMAVYPAEHCAGGWSLNITTNNVLYATFYSVDGLQNIYSYKINSDTGALSVINSVDGGNYPTSIVSTKDSRFAYAVTLLSPLNIDLFSIVDDGALSPLSPSTISTSSLSTLRFNTANDLLYGLDYSNGTYYAYNVSSGQLTNVLGPVTINNNNSAPYDVAFIQILQ